MTVDHYINAYWVIAIVHITKGGGSYTHQQYEWTQDTKMKQIIGLQYVKNFTKMKSPHIGKRDGMIFIVVGFS